MKRPEVVTLCGSTRFKTAFEHANYRETLRGHIVLSVGCFPHADGLTSSVTGEEKKLLDKLHRRKIDLSNRILVLNVGGYIGDSTRREIAYAKRTGKHVDYLEGLIQG